MDGGELNDDTTKNFVRESRQIFDSNNFRPE